MRRIVRVLAAMMMTVGVTAKDAGCREVARVMMAVGVLMTVGMIAGSRLEGW